MTTRNIVTMVVAAAAVLLVILVVSGCLFVVQQNEYGVVTEFGKVVDIKTEPGLYFKAPFVQSVSALPKTVLLYDLPISDVITADKHSMVLDSFTMWRISDPRLFIESLSGSLTNAESRINANVYNALKTVISSQNQEAIISGRDGLIVSLVMENIGTSFVHTEFASPMMAAIQGVMIAPPRIAMMRPDAPSFSALWSSPPRAMP